MAYKPKTIAEWFIHRAQSEGEYLTPMKLQKLVYISHGWTLGLYGDSLVSERVEAWQWGPVIRSIYATYARYGSRPIVEPFPIACPPVSNPRDVKLLEKVWEVYSKYTAAQLSELTHRANTPWSHSYIEGRKEPIPNALIENHYRDMANSQ